jgi:hypothetical protein
MNITPIHPHDLERDEVGPGAQLCQARRTLGRRSPSRRTLGRRAAPSRRTLGRRAPSRRTLGT